VEKEHLFSITKKDLEMQTFRSGGSGGQHQNKVSTGVRIIHHASGAVGESRSDKSQHRNRVLALKHLTTSVKFKVWLTRRAAEIISGKTIEEKVKELMLPQNLKIEGVDDNNNWVPL